ncbi:hypothetical protein LU351_17815 [Marinibactrum halimedae]|nr:hypothetical protein [Marinibactrum halimedae]
MIQIGAGDLALTFTSAATNDSVNFDIGTNDGNNNANLTNITLTASGDAAEDLQNLRDAINRDSGNNGLTASIDESGTLLISASDGDNIQLSNFQEVDGTGAASSAITFNTPVGAATGVADTIVGSGGGTEFEALGTLTFDSSESFRLVGTNIAELTATNIALEQTVEDVDVTTATGAQDAIAIIDGAIANIDSQRAQLGAVQNRFQNTIANLQNIQENVSAARSRIRDTDYASETAELTRQQILQQAGTSVLAQANQLPQAVLSLLG